MIRTVTVVRDVKEHYNLGSYEWAEAACALTLELEVPDGQVPDYDVLAHQIQTALDRLLQPERERYQRLTTEDNSSLHDHPALRSTHGEHVRPSPPPDHRGRLARAPR